MFALFQVLVTAQTEDLTTYMGSYSQNPSTVNFNDIFNTHILNGNDEVTDDFKTIATQFVEFHPSLLRISPITPPPRLLLSSSYSKKKKEETTTENGSTTTEEPEAAKVIPIRNHPRGVLDVLFPATRVRTFKNIFDTFRRVLSYTFKK